MLAGGLAVRSNITKFLSLGPSRAVAYTASPQYILKAMEKVRGKGIGVGLHTSLHGEGEGREGHM